MKVTSKAVQLRFRCSKCGSSEFGSHIEDEHMKLPLEARREHLVRTCSGCAHRFEASRDFENFEVKVELSTVWVLLDTRQGYEETVYVEVGEGPRVAAARCLGCGRQSWQEHERGCLRASD